MAFYRHFVRMRGYKTLILYKKIKYYTNSERLENRKTQVPWLKVVDKDLGNSEIRKENIRKKAGWEHIFWR